MKPPYGPFVKKGRARVPTIGRILREPPTRESAWLKEMPDIIRSEQTHACPRTHPASSLPLQMSERDKLMRAAERFLELVPVQTRERGRYYHATGHVLKVAGLKPDQAYAAIVRGNNDYAVRLTYSEQPCTSDCSCPMGYDCKHTVAAMLELQALWAKDPPATPATVSASSNKPSKKKSRSEEHT